MSEDLGTTPVAPGVVRLQWPPGFTGRRASDAADVVRRAVAAALGAGAYRVEVHVPADDVAGQRVAAFGGLRREGTARGLTDGADRVVFARLADDVPAEEPEGFRALLNASLPRKRAIGQMLVRDEQDRVLLCALTYKRDHDLPGGVVEVGESPREAVSREVAEELGLDIPAGDLLLTDWLPAWSGWDDAVCLVFDGGVHPAAVLEQAVLQPREIRAAAFHSLTDARRLCADFTARRVATALSRARGEDAPAYVESGGR